MIKKKFIHLPEQRHSSVDSSERTIILKYLDSNSTKKKFKIITLANFINLILYKTI